MAVRTNLTIESPNTEKITKEAGQFTADAVGVLWAALNDTRASQRRGERLAREMVAPKVISLAPGASVDDLDTQGASVIYFTGSTAVNLTGFRAPETGQTRVLFIYIGGTGTITVKNQLTSEAANRIQTSTNADVARTQYQGLVLVYLGSRWCEVARSG